MFYNGSKLERRLFLLGEAGMGKTTFSKHLTDAWCSIIADESCKSSLCTPAVLPQFVDIDVLKQFQYLFYVSCRFAGEKESIFDMIDNQLFDDEKMKNVAIYTLKHYPECCLIILDGADEWRGSPTSATGRRGDKAGLPSMAGIEKCVILITSRPWRFHALSTKIQSSFRQLKINGIKNEQELAQRILQKMDNPDPRRSAYMFLLEVGRQNMSALMKIPLMLIIMLGSWEHDKSLHKSMSINYINMIHSFICRSKGLAGWSSSDSKLRRLIPNLNHLETEWEQQANELPEVLSRYKHIRRFAGLFISLGQLAFDLLFGKEEQSLVFSKAVLKSYLRVDDENDEPLNVCLMLGILSKTKTKTRGLKKMESYAFSHKTFQEFFAVLWLASKYAHEKSKLYKNIKNVNDLYEFDTLIRFLCGLCPESGKHFWVFVTEQVTIREGEKEEVQRLICRYIKEQEFDINGPISDQSLFCIPHIKIIPYTSDEDIRLLCGVMEKYPCKVKTLCVNEDHPHSSLSEEQAVRICMSVSSCSSLQTLKLRQLKQSGTNIYKSNCPTLDLQKHHTMETLDLWQLSVKGLELPLEGTRLRSLGLTFLTIPHYSWEALGESVSSYTNLEELNLCYYTCSEHGRCCAIPLLDLQKHKRLEKLRLETISVKGLVLPLEGARFTFLHLKDVTMAQQGYEQLCESLSSCSSLVTLNLWTVTCSEHRFGHCQLVLDLQKHNRLEKLSLRCLPLDGVLLPVKGTRLKELQMYDLRIFHHSLQQLGDVSSWYGLVKIDLYQVSCIQHIHISCLPVLDLHKHSKLVTLRLWNPPGLLIPVEGARLRELSMYKVKMNLHSLEKLWESLSSCVSLERLRLMEVFFSADKAGCSPPLLDLQNHNALEKLELWDLSIEGLLLPLAGTRIKSLQLGKVSMAHNRLDQLGQVLSSCSAIHQLELEDVTCREHLNSCQPVRDLQNIYRGW